MNIQFYHLFIIWDIYTIDFIDAVFLHFETFFRQCFNEKTTIWFRINITVRIFPVTQLFHDRSFSPSNSAEILMRHRFVENFVAIRCFSLKCVLFLSYVMEQVAVKWSLSLSLCPLRCIQSEFWLFFFQPQAYDDIYFDEYDWCTLRMYAELLLFFLLTHTSVYILLHIWSLYRGLFSAKIDSENRNIHSNRRCLPS